MLSTREDCDGIYVAELKKMNWEGKYSTILKENHNEEGSCALC